MSYASWFVSRKIHAKQVKLTFFAAVKDKITNIYVETFGRIRTAVPATVAGIVLAVTALMGYYASQVKLSYEFSKAIPTDNPKCRDYIGF